MAGAADIFKFEAPLVPLHEGTVRPIQAGARNCLGKGGVADSGGSTRGCST